MKALRYTTTEYASKISRHFQLLNGWKELHHEVELGVVIGKEGACISEAAAMDHVAGYCLALDMTARTLQSELKSKGLPWALSKGFDTSCPVSEFIEKERVANPHDVDIWLRVNDEMRQDSNTRNMIFSLPFLVSYVSRFFTLEPGDLLLTGTPEGVGPVRDGDVITCGLKGLVEMSFKVSSR